MLNPNRDPLRQEHLSSNPSAIDLFRKGESPYFAMFRAGLLGLSLEECTSVCSAIGVPLREKDIRSWSDGRFKREMKEASKSGSMLNPVIRKEEIRRTPVLGSTLKDFDTYPDGWTGTNKRWFPCNKDNAPMQAWGYKKGFIPELYERASAIALSETGWVGQNLYAQPMIVIDIDGVGHGCIDEKVIRFGEKFKKYTEVWEWDKKPGSFHLYFYTNRVIPISHFNYAKLDLMGNQKNAAVYTKNKTSNGIPMAELTDDVWSELLAYVGQRRKERDNANFV